MQGSFERIGEIAEGVSVPADYLQTAEQHAAEGCYVLALAHRLDLVITSFAMFQDADCLAVLVNYRFRLGALFALLCCIPLQPHSSILLDGIVAGRPLHHYFPAGLQSLLQIQLLSASSNLPPYDSPQASAACSLSVWQQQLNDCNCRSLGHMSVQQAVSLSRDELESGLKMLALLLFRNELKPDTAEAVQSLKHGQVSAAVLCCAVLCCAVLCCAALPLSHGC